jgi:polyisoprenoid-binding protein YceI
MGYQGLWVPLLFCVPRGKPAVPQPRCLKAAGAGKLEITGDLTIHGVTKEVVLDVEGPSAPMKDPWGNQRIGASAATKINRMDFGVKGAPGLVGDEISITIDVELTQAK